MNGHGEKPRPGDGRDSNVPAEENVLGSVLRWNGCLDEVTGHIPDPSYFTDWPRRMIYEAMLSLHAGHKPIDRVSVAEWLYAHNKIEMATYPYLAELWDKVATGAGATYYAGIVREHAQRRQVSEVLAELLNRINAERLAPDEALAQLEREVLSLRLKGMPADSMALVAFLKKAMDQYDAAGSPEKGLLRYGFADLDEQTGGLHAGDLILLAARPSVGKTSLALSIINHVARQGVPVYFVSLEQAGAELAGRLLCMECMVDSLRWRQGQMTADEATRVNEGISGIATRPVHINDRAFRLGQILTQARRHKIKDKIGLVVVDYVQLIDPDNRRERRDLQIGEISRQLKLLAKDIEVPVLAVAQLNRAAEERADGEPWLSDLRDSGSLEQDGDVVLMLWKSRKEVAEPNVATVYCKIAKQRNGPTATVKLLYCKRHMLFKDAVPEGF